MAEDESNSDSSSSGGDSGDSGDSDGAACDDMGVRLVARSADGTKVVNAIDIFPRFELSV